MMPLQVMEHRPHAGRAVHHYGKRTTGLPTRTAPMGHLWALEVGIYICLTRAPPTLLPKAIYSRLTPLAIVTRWNRARPPALTRRAVGARMPRGNPLDFSLLAHAIILK